MLLQFWDLGWAWLHDWVAYLVWEHSHIRHPVDCSLDKWEERECCLWFSLYCTVAQVCSRGSDLWDKPSHINSCMEQQLRLRGQKWQSYCLSRGYRYRLPACSVARLCAILCDPMDCCPPDSSVHGISSKNTGAGCHFLLPGIFLTQGSNPHLLHWQAILDHWAARKLTSIALVTKSDFCCSVSKSCPIFASSRTAVCQASLSSTISWSLLKFMSIESDWESINIIKLKWQKAMPEEWWSSIATN